MFHITCLSATEEYEGIKPTTPTPTGLGKNSPNTNTSTGTGTETTTELELGKSVNNDDAVGTVSSTSLGGNAITAAVGGGGGTQLRTFMIKTKLSQVKFDFQYSNICIFVIFLLKLMTY